MKVILIVKVMKRDFHERYEGHFDSENDEFKLS